MKLTTKPMNNVEHPSVLQTFLAQMGFCFGNRTKEQGPTIPYFGYPISTTGNDDPLSKEQISAINQIERVHRLGVLGKLINFVVK